MASAEFCREVYRKQLVKWMPLSRTLNCCPRALRSESVTDLPMTGQENAVSVYVKKHLIHINGNMGENMNT